MKPIVLIAPFPKDIAGINEVTVSQPLGIASIAAILEEKNLPCIIIDANILRLNNKAVLDQITKIQPGVIGISVNVITAGAGFDLSRRIKQRFPETIVILGGPQANVNVKENLILSKADAVVTGEGELTMLEITQRYRDGHDNLFDGVKGIIYNRGEEIVANQSRERIQALDSLPLPAYHLLPNLNLYLTRARRKPAGSIITSRGCPFQCIYCNKNIFGSRVTALSAKRVIDLIDMLIHKHGVKQIDIYDDNFTLDKKRVNEIFQTIIDRKYKLLINLQTGVRADAMDREMILKMKRAGVFKIGFGVESGSQRMLKIAKKELDLNKVLEATRLAKEAGIITYGFFILGLPGENEETLKQTIEFAKKMDPLVANFCLAMPFPGTEMYDMVKKDGNILIETTTHAPGGFYGSHAFFEYGELKEATLLKYFRRAYYSFYFRPRKILQTLTTIQSWHELKWILGAGTKLILTAIRAGFNRRKNK